jgi:RNA methyltransferase, TrmH family
MVPIKSPHNPKLKALRKLTRASQRARTGLFVAEGEDLLAAAAQAGRPAVEAFKAPGMLAGEPGFHEVEPDVLASVSTLGSGTRAIGVYEQRWQAPMGPLCVYLHGVGDPGNVGTVLRGAHAFGASCVALGPGCADPHSPKAVRASMGAIFAVALARVADVGELPGTKVALVAGQGQPIWDALKEAATASAATASAGVASAAEAITAAGVAPGPGLTLLVGAEREGLPPEVVAACEKVAHIPIVSESLNAAMAATVALYETTRHSTRVPAS